MSREKKNADSIGGIGRMKRDSHRWRGTTKIRAPEFSWFWWCRLSGDE